MVLRHVAACITGGERVTFLQAFNGLDWIVIGVVLIGAVTGFFRGFIGMAVSVVGTLIAFLVAGRLAGPVVLWLDTHTGMVTSLARLIQGHLPLPPDLARIPLNTLPTSTLVRAVSSLPFPEFYKSSLLSKLATLVESEGARTVGDLLFRQIATGIMAAAIFVPLVVLLTWTLTAVASNLSRFLNLVPLVGTVNRLLGALVGAVEMVLAAAVVMALLPPILALPQTEQLAVLMAHSRTAGPLLDLYGLLGARLLGHGNAFFLGI